MGLVDRRETQLLHRRALPFIPYDAYDPTAGGHAHVLLQCS